MDTGKNAYSRHSGKPRPSHAPKVLKRPGDNAPTTQVEIADASVAPVVIVGVSEHTAASDPHTQYAENSDLSAHEAEILQHETAEMDDTLVLAPDGAGGVEFRPETGGSPVADILDLPTAETDDTLVLAPDGAGGVEFRPETGGGGVSSGTSFPGSPSTNELFYRTDHAMFFYYDGARWLCTCPHEMPFAIQVTAQGLYPTTSGASIYAPVPPAIGGMTDIYITHVTGGFYVVTTNNGSNYWTVAGLGASWTTAADSPNTPIKKAYSTPQVSNLAGNAWQQIDFTRTAAAGGIYGFISYTYRYIGT